MAQTGALSCHGTLVAATAETFDLTGITDEVLITNQGNVAGAVIYVRSDGVTAVVAADETVVILPAQSRRFRSGGAGNPPTYSIISASAVTVSVEAA